MRTLPLYESLPRAVLETTPGRELDPTCTKCELHARVRTVCLGADGEPGGLLVVGESPGRNEDLTGRPFIGEAGGLLRRVIKRHWRGGPVVLDNALRCAPGKAEVKEKHVEACRAYLAETLKEARPTRVVTLGAWAAMAVLGRGTAPFSTRRGYAYLTAGSRPVPVFMVLHPAAALRNRFVAQWFERDMEWALNADPPRPPWDADVHVVETAADAAYAIETLRAAGWSMFDVESAGLLFDPSFRLLSVSFCAKGERDAWAWDREALARPEVVGPMFAYLADPRAVKGGTNVKFDMLAAYCESRGVMPRGVKIDVRLWRKLLEPEADAKLDRMAELVGMGGMKEESKQHLDAGKEAVTRILSFEKRLAKREAKIARGEKVSKTFTLLEGPQTLAELGIDPALERVVRNDAYDKDAWAYALVPPEVLVRYNARDAVATTSLAEKVEPELRAVPQLARVWDTIVEGASRAVAQVETWGVAANRDAIVVFDQYLEVRENELRGKLDGYAKLENWNSRDQIADLLFHKLKLPVVKLTDGGDESTDKDTLEQLRGKHPLVGHLIDYRGVTKLRGTYARGLLPFVRPDGRIHPTLLLDGARTGRWSCAGPNLQNQPRAKLNDGGVSKMVRDNFVASPGSVLLEFDYSQIEIRVAAMLSQDPAMMAILASGVDFHQKTAELIAKVAWGIDPSQVTEDHRSIAKTVNFGVLYGKTANTFAAEWGVAVSTAQAVIDAIFGQFQRLAVWMREMLSEARRTGEVWTWWRGQKARRRPLWRVADADDYARSVAEHGAVNTPVQGTANEFCVASLVAATEWIEADAVPAKLVLAVHDSMLFDVAEEAVDEVLHMVPRIMLGHDSNGVQLKVDAKRGPAWGSLEKVKKAA